MGIMGSSSWVNATYRRIFDYEILEIPISILVFVDKDFKERNSYEPLFHEPRYFSELSYNLRKTY